MKKSITILFLLLGLVVKAQDDITLFRFISKKEVNGKTYALTANLKDDSYVAKEVSDKNFNLETGYLDAFLIIPHPEFKNGEVLIVSAKDKKKFLKRSQSLPILELGNYYTDTDRLKKHYYKWQLNYAGSNDQVSIQVPFENELSGVLTLENGVFKIKRVEDTKGIVSTDNKGTNGDRISDKQIIVIQRLKNSL